MAKIEKIISATDFEQGSIYVDSGETVDSTTGLRSISIISIDKFKKFVVDAQDISGESLSFSFVGYDSSGRFVDCSSVSLGWKDSGTEIDIRAYPSIIGIKILLNSNNSITPSQLENCKLTLTHTWSISDSYPYNSELDAPMESFIEPYPEGIYVQNKNEYPKFTFLDVPIQVLLEPYPQGVYTQEKGKYPSYSALELVRMGAFTYASNLEKVRIPESVKYIGEWAFTYTKLKEVTIASDCTYFPTSFPEDCEIKFY